MTIARAETMPAGLGNEPAPRPLLSLVPDREEGLAETPEAKVLAAAKPVVKSRSACADYEFPEFFPDPQNRRDFQRASQVCRFECPRAAECFEEALSRGNEWGVWGGAWFVDGEVRQEFRRPRRSLMA